jgi:hypothetical protein
MRPGRRRSHVRGRRLNRQALAPTGFRARTTVPRAPNFSAFRRVSSNADRE